MQKCCSIQLHLLNRCRCHSFNSDVCVQFEIAGVPSSSGPGPYVPGWSLLPGSEIVQRHRCKWLRRNFPALPELKIILKTRCTTLDELYLTHAMHRSWMGSLVVELMWKASDWHTPFWSPPILSNTSSCSIKLSASFRGNTAVQAILD
ncbi:hypothetical protein BSKO_00710 [Bryopsis sp. KO-2023]|nr:hypothetical protein BSKO_00710 [Bryopsis sp. KO-2023]